MFYELIILKLVVRYHRIARLGVEILDATRMNFAEGGCLFFCVLMNNGTVVLDDRNRL